MFVGLRPQRAMFCRFDLNWLSSDPLGQQKNFRLSSTQACYLLINSNDGKSVQRSSTQACYVSIASAQTGHVSTDLNKVKKCSTVIESKRLCFDALDPNWQNFDRLNKIKKSLRMCLTQPRYVSTY